MTRVLVNGEAVAPPAGRSDDFTWPRRAIAPFGTDPVVATTTRADPGDEAGAGNHGRGAERETRPVAAAAAPRRGHDGSRPHAARRSSSRSQPGFFSFFR